MRFLTFFFFSRIDDRWCNCHLRVIVDLDINCLICQRLQSWIMSGIHKEKMNGQNTLILPEWRALVAMSLVPDWKERGWEGSGSEQSAFNPYFPFFAANHMSHLECFHVLLCVVITCSYIVLDKKVKNQRISDHIRAEGIIFSTSKFETRGTWCILYHTLYFILSHLYSAAQFFHNTIINHCHCPFSHATHVLLFPKAFQLFLTHWTCLSASCIVFLLCIHDYESGFQ